MKIINHLLVFLGPPSEPRNAFIKEVRKTQFKVGWIPNEKSCIDAYMIKWKPDSGDALDFTVRSTEREQFAVIPTASYDGKGTVEVTAHSNFGLSSKVVLQYRKYFLCL